MRSGSLTFHVQPKSHQRAPPYFSSSVERAQKPLIQKTGSGPSLQPETFPNQRWAPRYVRQLELLLPFSSNEASVPNQQRTSVTEKRTGALTQGRTDATLYDTLTCVLLSLWSSRCLSQCLLLLVVLALQPLVHKLTLLFLLLQAQGFAFFTISKSSCALSFWH